MQVVAIFGPTGVGKTGVAMSLAEILRERGEDPVAISCDALQVYEGLGTLTGAASASERERLEHRLLGFVPVSRPFSVGDYMPLAHGEIDRALNAGRRPIVVGGTGLYLRAALAELSLRKVPAEKIRQSTHQSWLAVVAPVGSTDLRFGFSRGPPQRRRTRSAPAFSDPRVPAKPTGTPRDLPAAPH